MADDADLDTASGPRRNNGSSRRGTAHVYVREMLRQDILNGVLPAGARLGQSDLADQLGVSTTPVREALRDLASEGLVIIDPHRGGFVMELSRADVLEIYQIRHELEPLALRFALPHITDTVVERLDELNEEMNATSHLATWVGLNRDFHMTLYEVANRPRLLSMIGSLQDGSVMAVGSLVAHENGVREEANHEHGALVEAIRRRDTEDAIAALQHHLSRHAGY